ncbi:MAG TPA: carbamoyltransferase C-terminal domain-containing protein [Candidatus Omnitrophota bacterium]|nr:carbamoyltransferase C-terminal domain-containing protein [Candidatus Omnitrophota bacterium]
MIVLGVGTIFHDPAACILVDGKLVAAVEEERLIREKHATGKCPVRAVHFCLKQAGLKPSDIQEVAFPWDPAVYDKYKWSYFFRNWRSRPSQAYKAIVKCAGRKRSDYETPRQVLREAGFDLGKIRIHHIQHHIAHGASAFYFSGFPEAAVLSIDGAGEFPATMLGVTEKGRIRILKEICFPDSLGFFYSTLTEYLGFERMDGEYKLMGMAPYGDPARFNFEDIIRYKGGSYRVNDDYIWVPRVSRYRKGVWFSKKMVKRFGPPRTGDGLSEPYIHIAAVTQQKLEEISIRLLEDYLADALKRCGGRLCFSGGCALNVKLNQRLIAHPLVKELWVQPASSDAGGCLGAAAVVAHEAGDRIEPMRHVYYGPEYSDSEIARVFQATPHRLVKEASITERVSELLAKGEIVAWFQGRMEWGPRALGNRSILSNPTVRGMADRINEIIKFRERWRPFCPSLLYEKAFEVLDTTHDSPFMTFSFQVRKEWKDRIPEVVHVDGSVRPQFVKQEQNPRYYELLQRFYKKTGVPILMNTSLNRRGEPMVCAPEDALKMFEGSALKYLAIGDYLVTKQGCF